ncbi:putative G-protein coupled receptor family C group 6 member A-like [Scophthalmus maximus]|uniref:Putative G-protein coupled receptor family C group 6 member A-like n=1 Tax=Scophthalmus maximus TaxID=52904 RepID=A0A2U9CL64_SCOMX|nr:putative G-protein coupled receptor family C group 6 member A-like [Scophthalmus maximus]
MKLQTISDNANYPILLPTSFSIQTFLNSQVMIYAIRELNQRTPRVLPNITIGYDIYDTCGDVSLAIRATLQLLQSQTDHQNCSRPANTHASFRETQLKAVIGDSSSEVSVAVARITALSSVAQISYASTSERLSNKMKFPTFLRTISSDENQAKAIADLVMKLNWTAVAIVGSDDAYGRYSSERLEKTFKDTEICIDFINILPSYFSQNKSETHKWLTDLVSSINSSVAEAIIIFTKSSNVKLVIEAAIKGRLNRTWIASDSWSTSKDISSMQDIELAGKVFGFISKKNDVPGFKNYVISNFKNTTNAFLDHYLTRINCSHESKIRPEGSKQWLDPSCLTKHIDRDYSYNTYLAVRVIGEGLRRLLKCDNQQCERTPNFTALELLMEIKKVNFTVNNTHIHFDSKGDPSLGYDIVYWSTNISTRKTHIETIGAYFSKDGVKIPEGLESNVNVSVYNCSKKCDPGQQLQEQGKRCCKICVQCAEGDFSPKDGEECKSCGEEKYSSPQKDTCLDKPVYPIWLDPFNIILCCFQSLGIIVTVVFIIVFTIYRNTPVVKAVGGNLCFLELFSLLACFCLTFNLNGRPTKASCTLGLPVFGIAFCLCISCILVNLLQIVVGFSFSLNTGTWIKKLNKPVAVVSILSGIQFALFVPGFYYFPLTPQKLPLAEIIVYQCNTDSIVFIGLMLGYNTLLALIGFLLAIKGKELPDLYNNALSVAVSMLLHLLICIIFIPIYMNLIGKYKRATAIVTMLASSYSIVCFHLAPKFYIMLFRQEINNERAITENIRMHYVQRGLAVVTS